MNNNQKKLIESSFYNYPNNAVDEWNAVVKDTLTKCAFETSESVIKLYFFEKRKLYNVCKTLNISQSAAYYHLSNVRTIALAFAEQRGLL